MCGVKITGDDKVALVPVKAYEKSKITFISHMPLLCGSIKTTSEICQFLYHAMDLTAAHASLREMDKINNNNVFLQNMNTIFE